MNIDVFSTLSEEHKTLIPLILAIQAAAEAGDRPSLTEKLAAGHQALTAELDVHMVQAKSSKTATFFSHARRVPAWFPD